MQSIASYDGVPPWEDPVPEQEQFSYDTESETSNNPGFDLFESDSNDDRLSIPDGIILPSSDSEVDSNVNHPPITLNNPILTLPNRGHLDPTSNWLQSSSGSDSDPDHDQFLLNANDMYSDEAWSSCSDAVGNDIGQDGFDINDGYIDDDFSANNTNLRLQEPSQGPEEQYSSSELDNYFLDPNGLNLIDPFVVPQTLDNDAHDGDPEPSPGPFDPG